MKYRLSARAASAAVLFSSLAAPLVPETDAELLGAWSLDETAGTIADSSGTNVPGKAFSAVRYASDGVPDGTYGVLVVTGSAGKSAGFGPAKGQYFEVGADNNTPILNIPPTGSFTVMGWISLDGPNTGNNMMLGTGGQLGAARGWRLGVRATTADGTGAVVRFTTYNVADLDSQPIKVTYGTWMHVAATYAGGAVRYFVDGSQLTDALSQDTSVFLDETVDARLTIGARRGGTSSDQCNGRLDGVRVYSTVLTEAEIQAAALESLAPVAVTPPPVYHWTGAPGAEWSTTASSWDAGLWINGFDAVFDTAAGGDVTLPANVFPHSLTVSGAGSWTLTGTNVGVSGYGPLTMNGTGTLTLNSTTSTSGATVVNSGTLDVLALHGLSTGAALTVAAGGTLSGTGPVAGAIEVHGTLSPGSPASHQMLALPVTFHTGSKYRWECGLWNGAAQGTDYDFLSTTTLTLTATPADKFTVIVTGTPADFTESDKTFTIASASAPVTGFDPAAVSVSVSGFAGTGQWSVQLDATSLQLQLVYTAGTGGGGFTAWAAGKGLTGADALAEADPDHDGISNQLEYAFGGEPSASASRGYCEVFTADTTADGWPELILTLAVQTGVTYTVEGSIAVGDFTAPVEGPLAVPALPAGWPAEPPAGFAWQSFRLAGSNGLAGRGWLRVKTVLPPAAP